MTTTFRAFTTAAALALAMPAFADGLMVHDAYARSASPAAKSGAAFIEIMNHGDADDRLIGAASPAAKLVELHTHIESDAGVMQMVHVEDGFAVPAGETLVMERGGKHVMLMGLTAPLEQGAMVPITLTFEQAGDMTIDVAVDLERKPGAGEGHDHSMDHDHEKSE